VCVSPTTRAIRPLLVRLLQGLTCAPVVTYHDCPHRPHTHSKKKAASCIGERSPGQPASRNQIAINSGRIRCQMFTCGCAYSIRYSRRFMMPVLLKFFLLRMCRVAFRRAIRRLSAKGIARGKIDEGLRAIRYMQLGGINRLRKMRNPCGPYTTR